MSIEVIGAGMGRTGTLSLKFALEELGYNKTHHMFELFQNPQQLPYWLELQNSGKTDLDTLFQGYTAAVDFPASIYYKAIIQKYPNAKVILTARDAEKWYKSTSDTLFKAPPKGFPAFMMWLVGLFNSKVSSTRSVISYTKLVIWKTLFKGNFQNKKKAIEIYNNWNEEVKRYVAKDKLLIFDVSEGWGPLCAFLNKPVPDKPFPRVNDTASFNNRKKIITKKGKTEL